MFHVLTKIIYGNFKEKVNELKEKKFLEGNGLLCTGRHYDFYNDLKFLNLKILRIHGEPTLEDIKNYWNEIKDENFDYVIGIGGGSVLDSAKILAARMTNKDNIENFIGVENVKNRIKKFVAIPTTHGSGSEVTKYSVVKFQDSKKTIVSEKTVPDFAIIDENLTIDLPDDYTLYTSIDAFCHNIESYLSKYADQMIDVIAENGIFKFFEGIEDGMDKNFEKRKRGKEKLMTASVLGGIAITNAGTNLIHALSHVIGMRNIPHGLANALFLKAFLNFYKNEEKFENLNKKVKKIFGKDIIERIDEIYEKYNVPKLGKFYDKKEAKEIVNIAARNERLMKMARKETRKEDLEKIVFDSF